jgi:hypothetical protein
MYLYRKRNQFYMVQTPRIRVGILGLNALYSGTPTGTSWAASSHLPYLQSSSKNELVVLQSSSAERAALAIKAYRLDPKKVKAYRTPEGKSSFSIASRFVKRQLRIYRSSQRYERGPYRDKYPR